MTSKIRDGQKGTGSIFHALRSGKWRQSRFCALFRYTAVFALHFISMWLPLAALAAAPVFTFHVAGEDPGAWPDILSAAGFVQGGAAGSAGIVVLRPGEGAPFAQWIARVEQIGRASCRERVSTIV